MEAEALKDLLIRRLGKDFNRLILPAHRNTHQMRHERSANAFVPQSIAHGNTFNNVFVQSASGKNLIVANCCHYGIIVQRIQAQPVGSEESRNALAVCANG